MTEMFWFFLQLAVEMQLPHLVFLSQCTDINKSILNCAQFTSARTLIG
jgi:hypothetical protein